MQQGKRITTQPNWSLSFASTPISTPPVQITSMFPKVEKMISNGPAVIAPGSHIECGAVSREKIDARVGEAKCALETKRAAAG